MLGIKIGGPLKEVRTCPASKALGRLAVAPGHKQGRPDGSPSASRKEHQGLTTLRNDYIQISIRLKTESMATTPKALDQMKTANLCTCSVEKKLRHIKCVQ